MHIVQQDTVSLIIAYPFGEYSSTCDHVRPLEHLYRTVIKVWIRHYIKRREFAYHVQTLLPEFKVPNTPFNAHSTPF